MYRSVCGVLCVLVTIARAVSINEHNSGSRNYDQVDSSRKWPAAQLSEIVNFIKTSTNNNNNNNGGDNNRQHAGMLLLDVRNRSELRRPGRMPFSVNVPLHELSAALTLTQHQFSSKYGFSMTRHHDADIVITCRSGRRAQVAAALLHAHNVTTRRPRVFYGSFNQWTATGQPYSAHINCSQLNAMTSRRHGDNPARRVIIDTRPSGSRPATDLAPGQVRSIPYETLSRALFMSPEHFADKHDFIKPQRNQTLVLIGSNWSQLRHCLPILDKSGYHRLRLFVDDGTCIHNEN